MTATTETRKRSREDDSSDSMPLSKRINNLHINNSLDVSSNLQNLGHNSASHIHGVSHSTLRDEGGTFTGQIADGSSQESFHNSYNPELNQHENPYYYNKNKLLYELHLERVRRTN